MKFQCLSLFTVINFVSSLLVSPFDSPAASHSSKAITVNAREFLPLGINSTLYKVNSLRRVYVRTMMKHAWDGYVTYSWGENELRPVSCRGNNYSVFGTAPLAITIIESLSTLYVMGMMPEYRMGRDWVATNLSVNTMTMDTSLSAFEMNIRFIGGLLSMFALTYDTIFRDKAKQMADKLMFAFDTETGIPLSVFNLKTRSIMNYAWANAGDSILSELGTFHLEFSYLSDITGDPKYRNKVKVIRDFLKKMDKPNGLYPVYLNPKTGTWGKYEMSLGALADSFYEYLLKSWLQSNKKDSEARTMFDEAMQAILDNMMEKSRGNLTFVSDMSNFTLENKMDHLACFAGGLFALASTSLDNEYSSQYMDVAKELTNTCHETYLRSQTGLGPENFYFNFRMEAMARNFPDKQYLLRPELIESYFYLWRVTKEQKYRDWGWEFVLSLERFCRVKCGYSGIRNVYSKEPNYDDVQQSFFLAETLKYLYLLYSEDNLFALNQWVFNTEGHPLPIKDAYLLRLNEDETKENYWKNIFESVLKNDELM